MLNKYESVGNILKRNREKKHLTTEKIASLLGCSQPKISQLENNRVELKPLDFAKLEKILEFSKEEKDFIEKEVLSDHITHYDFELQKGILYLQKEWLETQEKTSIMRMYGNWFLPGHLQISSYINKVFECSEKLFPILKKDSKENLLKPRLSSQELLKHPAKIFYFVVSEVSFYYNLSKPIMLEQIQSLLNYIEDIDKQEKNGYLYILPLDSGINPMLCASNFFIFDDSLVSIELSGGILNLREKNFLEIYLKIFQEMIKHSITEKNELIKFLKRMKNYYAKKGSAHPQKQSRK